MCGGLLDAGQKAQPQRQEPAAPQPTRPYNQAGPQQEHCQASAAHSAGQLQRHALLPKTGRQGSHMDR